MFKCFKHIIGIGILLSALYPAVVQAQWINPPASEAADSSSRVLYASNDRQEEMPIIKNIRIKGSQRVDPNTILSYMSLQPGDKFDIEKLNQSIKRLYATGLFKEVDVNRYGDVLEIEVEENPVINEIAFEGNNRLEDEILANEISLRERMVFTKSRVQNDTNRLEQVYRANGRYGVKIEPKVIERPQNRVDLVFEVDEGAKTEIRNISFIGNKNFSDGTLRSAIVTKESAWYRFLSGGDTYDPDRLTYDRELLRQFYLENGFADFRVISAVAELAPDQDEFFITFTLEEGPEYEVSGYTLNSNIPNLSVERLREDITIEAGDTYDASKVDRTVQLLTDKAGTLGYAFVDVQSDIQRNTTNNTIAVAFTINPGPKVYVERINIEGNSRTLDHVIRREFRLVEGDAFNTDKLKRSKQRINNLGYFETVEVNTRQGSSPDKVIIDVEVAEKSTGEISFGAGFSTTESLLGDIRLRERNFLGRGQDLRLGFTFSGSRQEYDISFTEPYFLGRDLRAGFDIFRTSRELNDNSSFDEERTGTVLRIGYAVNEHLRNDFNYSFKKVNITDVDADASRFIRDQEGLTTTSSVGFDITYDKLDSRIEPSNGYLLKYGNDLAGLGGDSKFLRTEVSAAYYTPVFDEEEWILSLKAKTGYVAGYAGRDVKISERYFIGGNDFRGFEYGGIGPRDTVADDPLGANYYAIGSADIEFPLGLPNEFGIKGRFFTDFGTVSGVDDNGPEVADEASLRITAGAGIAWKSPFGPVRVDLALPVAKEDFDEDQFFNVNFGTRF